MIIDASALIAIFRDEPGRKIAEDNIPGAAISSVNFAEVAEVMLRVGYNDDESRRLLFALDLEIVPPDAAQALAAGRLIRHTRPLGLSLADRFCLTLAIERKRVALTTDRAWAKLQIEGLEVQLIR